jgi:O-antigen ligase
MDALLSRAQRFSLERWVPFFLGLSLFALPLSSTAKSISLSLAVAAILLTPTYRSQLASVLQTSWCKAAIFLFVVAVLACLWSPANYSDQIYRIEKYSKLLYLPILVLGFRDEKSRAMGFNGFFAAMFLTSCFAILLVKGFLPFLKLNPDDLFRNHILVGYMLDFAAYAAALFAYRQRGLKRLGYALLFCLFTYHVLCVNGGRMGYIVYYLSMLLLIVQLFSWRQALVAVIVLVGSFFLVYSQTSFMKERIRLLQTQYENYQHNDGDNSVGFRLQFHAYAHELFNRHPLRGNGTSSFPYYFKLENPVPGWRYDILEPHSQYWLIASEFGLLGVIALLAFFLTLLQASWRLASMRPLALGMLLSFLIGNLSDSLLLYSGSGYFFILFMALCLGEDPSRRRFGASSG